MDPALEAWITLSLVPGVGDKTLRKLLDAFGAPEKILAASQTQLAGSVGMRLAGAIKTPVDQALLDKTLGWLEEENHHALTLADPKYPALLAQTADPPTLLYVRGNEHLLNAPAIAVVGSRNATPQGIENAESFSKALSGSGLCVVSGLALGIDAAAHRGGLAEKGSSIAVLGTGIDRIYPAANKELAHRLAAEGALVSEFPFGTPAAGGNFPRRNRIISGLSLGVLVVEAAASSGSLITARLAGDEGREVFAIPGSIHSPLSKGCHQLIKQGAKLAESATDILEELRWPVNPASVGATDGLEKVADVNDELLAQFGYDPETIDTLAARCGLSAEQVSARLLQLELNGLIQSLPGGRYQRLFRSP